ncbi:MAG: type IV pilin [Nitrososphaerota archaeon]|nr:type IV pilin [Nitrososphaerota archaeon]
MNLSALRKHGKKAITPVLATIILIAITLIAGVAIGGFVFGLFGTLGSAPQVTAVTNSLAYGTANTAVGMTCAATPSGSWIQLKNTGSAAANVLSMTVSYNGAPETIPATGTCSVAVGGTTYILVTGLGGPAANPGDSFQGSVALSNGAPVPFVGTFH